MTLSRIAQSLFLHLQGQMAVARYAPSIEQLSRLTGKSIPVGRLAIAELDREHLIQIHIAIPPEGDTHGTQEGPAGNPNHEARAAGDDLALPR